MAPLIISGLSDLAGCAGYGRKFEDQRYLVGLSTLSHISAETSPSPGIAASQKKLEELQKENLQDSLRP